MPGDAAGRAILIAVRIVLAAVLLAGILAAFFSQFGQRRKALAVFRKTRPAGGGDAFFVKHASEANLADRSKAFAGDAFGVLTVTPRAVVFRAEAAAEAARNVEFLPGHARAEWVGRKWMNGAFSWFAVTADGETHYFTSAERATVWGSQRRTRKIHDAVRAHLP
jgi:hypothetical protein